MKRITDRAEWAGLVRSIGLGRDPEIETEVEDMGDGAPRVVILRAAPGVDRIDLAYVELPDLIDWSTR